MKRFLFALLIVGLGLVGRGVLAQPSDRPEVTVLNGEIRVQPDPLRFEPGRRNVHINWRLPNDSPHRFAENGIVIDREVTNRSGGQQTEVIDCRVTADGKQFSCLNKNTRPGVYKYTIRLMGLPPKDPSIVNMQ